MIQKILEVSTLIFHVGTAKTRLLVPCFLPPRLTGAVYHYFYETSFHSYCKMWILRLRFINGAYTTFSCSWGILERVSGTTDRTRWAISMACSFPRFQSTRFLFFTSGDIWSPLVMLKALTTSRACNNKYRMYYRWLIRHLQFSSDSRSHCSRRATSCVGGQGGQFEHFLQFSGKHKSETMLQESYVHITYFSCIMVLIRFM